jgi:hypothetical protein
MEIANTKREFTFVVGNRVPEKELLYERRNQDKLQMKAPVLTLRILILPESLYLFENKSL